MVDSKFFSGFHFKTIGGIKKYRLLYKMLWDAFLVNWIFRDVGILKRFVREMLPESASVCN